jgi:hypothetical protein
MQRHRDLTAPDLAQRPGVLALDPGRALAVLRHTGVIQHPRLRLDHRAHPLGDRTIDDLRIPRTVGQEMLQRLILDLPAAQARHDRLKRLARPHLDQPAPVQLGVAPLLRAPEPRRDIGEVHRQTIYDQRHHPDQLLIDPVRHASGNHDSQIRRNAT